MRTSLTTSLLALSLMATALAQEPHRPLQLASRSGSLAERHGHYRTIIEEHTGGPCGDQVWVIGLRGLAPDGQRRDSSQNAGPYGDTLVVVAPDGSVEELPGATHAGAERSPDCPFGVSQLRPGSYQALPVPVGKGEVVWRLHTPDGGEALPAWLDRDGNGRLTDDEKSLDEHYGTRARGLEISNGRDPKLPRSVGAQTLPPQEFQKFVAAVGANRNFNYLLIDANNPVKQESRDLRALATPLSPADDFRFYERIALENGVAPGFSRLVVVLRGLAPSGQRHASTDNIGPYNDTVLVLRRYAEGATTHALLGSAHAGQASTSRSPGCYAGIAQLRPGLYHARSHDRYLGYWSWHIVNHETDYRGNVPAWRDRDKDGYISPAEKEAAERRGVTANEILIHNGVDSEVGSSIGCVTMPPDVMWEFVNLVGEGSSFPFLLLDANAD